MKIFVIEVLDCMIISVIVAVCLPQTVQCFEMVLDKLNRTTKDASERKSLFQKSKTTRIDKISAKNRVFSVFELAEMTVDDQVYVRS